MPTVFGTIAPHSSSKIDRVGPVDNRSSTRPSSDKPKHFEKKKLNKCHL